LIKINKIGLSDFGGEEGVNFSRQKKSALKAL
jgi:hypothetical protein